jgi:hypothetical protein
VRIEVENLLAPKAAATPWTWNDVVKALTESSELYQPLSFDDMPGNALAHQNGTSMLETIVVDTDDNQADVVSAGKHLGRLFLHLMVNDASKIDPLARLCDAGNVVQAGGAVVNCALLDEAMDRLPYVADFFILSTGALNTLKSLGVLQTRNLPFGGSAPSYKTVPIFRNDYIPIASDNGAAIYCGLFDNGGRDRGLAGICQSPERGMRKVVVSAGKVRIKWYAGLALFDKSALSMIEDVKIR